MLHSPRLRGTPYGRVALALAVVLAVVLPTLTACSSGLLDVDQPSTVSNPALVNSQAGAVGLYSASVTNFATIFAGTPRNTEFSVNFGNSVAMASGLASDEFTTGYTDTDLRNYLIREVGVGHGATTVQPYTGMHTTRLTMDQAIGALRQYGKTTPASYVGELFALKGYLYIMFGELYCSGVPFSRTVYGGDIVVGSPESTTEMFEHAVAQFDTALAITTDSVQIRQLALVGKARALVNLAKFADAATLVTQAQVPTNFTYSLTYSTTALPNYFTASRSSPRSFSDALFMADRRGDNGLAYASAGDATNADPDPRVTWDPIMSSDAGDNFPIPIKFPNGSAPVALGDGIEARLIEAEAALQAHDVATWTALLNDLRATKGIPSLSTDSTTTAADTLRENVMFRERAFWLYGTGHRLGDMRRLVRQYNRLWTKIFPVGNAYPNEREVNYYYSSNLSFEPPPSEAASNPKYRGCLSHDP